MKRWRISADAFESLRAPSRIAILLWLLRGNRLGWGLGRGEDAWNAAAERGVAKQNSRSRRSDVSSCRKHKRHNSVHLHTASLRRERKPVNRYPQENSDLLRKDQRENNKIQIRSPGCHGRRVVAEQEVVKLPALISTLWGAHKCLLICLTENTVGGRINRAGFTRGWTGVEKRKLWRLICSITPDGDEGTGREHIRSQLAATSAVFRRLPSCCV